MKTIGLTDFFDKIKYDWNKDKEKIAKICELTKTRVDLARDDFSFDYGSEQVFLLKAIAEWKSADSFFEIGTGRGTACYTISLCPHVEDIVTIDIIPPTLKRQESVKYRSADVSNMDLYEMVPYEEKNKILFKHRSEVFQIINEYKDYFDLCFIDGNHDNEQIIMSDFEICKNIMTSDGLIVWDDYDKTKYSVAPVVDMILKENENYDALLIEFRGHLFDNRKEKNAGILLMKDGKFEL